MEIKTLQQKAQRLHDLRSTIALREEELKQLLTPLKTARDELQEELLADMRENEVATLKVDSGESYVRAVRKGIQVTLEAHARKWAIENGAVQIDRRLVAQALKDATELPDGFERVETPYISIRSSKKDE